MTLLSWRKLPPSELIRGGEARDEQVAHALARLGYLYLRDGLTMYRLNRVLSDEGFLHSWLHRMDAGTHEGWTAGREWALGLAGRLGAVERRVWR